MVSTDNKKDKKQNKTSIKEAGGIHGWLLKKAKTFMWDGATNTLTLPKGVVLSVDEKKALQEVLGAIVEEAQEVENRRQQQMMSMAQAGIRNKAALIKDYQILLSGSYRELTGILAHRIHTQLGNMLSLNNRFLNGLWQVISGISQTPPKRSKNKSNLPKKVSRSR